MATNRTRRARNRTVIPLDETIIRFLLFGKAERDTPAWELMTSRFFNEGDKIRETWEAHRPVLMAEWKKTGRDGLPWGERYIRDPYEALYGDDDDD